MITKFNWDEYVGNQTHEDFFDCCSQKYDDHMDRRQFQAEVESYFDNMDRMFGASADDVSGEDRIDAEIAMEEEVLDNIHVCSICASNGQLRRIESDGELCAVCSKR